MRRKAAVWLAIACVLALTLSASGPGLASGGHGEGSDKDGGQGAHGERHGYGRFDDVEGANWAYPDITKMEVKGVFGGYGNGKFGPQDSVSCLQLAILAVRVTGATDAAMTMTQEQVDAALAGAWLDPADPVPDWPGARACLAYAYENGYLNGFINQEKVTFRPTQPATRLEVIVTLIDAMGLTAAAAALADAPINAPDAATVPAWAHGYVSLAMDMGLLRGDNAGALNLDASVNRAQTAALLRRSNDQCGSDVDDRTIKGKLVSVTTGATPSITIEAKGEELNDYAGEEGDESDDGTPPAEQPAPAGPEPNYGEDEIVTKAFPVSADAPIFRDGALATLEQLVVGDRVEIRLDAAGVVVFIDARAPKVDVSDCSFKVGGPYMAAAYTGEVLTSITIVVASVEAGDEESDRDESGPAIGEQVTFAVSPAVEFRGAPDATVTFAEGDYLTLKLKQDEVVAIHFRDEDEDDDEDEDEADEDEADEAEAKGKIEVTFVSAGSGTLTATVTAVDENLPDLALGATVTLPVSGDLEIQGPDDQNLTLADLTAGLTLTLKIEDGVITGVKIGGEEHEEDDD